MGARTHNLSGRHRACPYRDLQAGLTLIELIVVMIVISVALVGVMSVINYTTRHSADPVLRHQAIAIAEAYMEEIVLKSFCPPDDDFLGCDPTGGVQPGSRTEFAKIWDYNDLDDEGVRNPIEPSDPIEGLGGYSVWVTISKQRITNDGFVADSSSNDALRINVTVRSPAGEEITLTSYRTNY